MQASKIMPNAIYAIYDKDKKLVRFRVTAVVTKRVNTHNNPHDYESWVEGYVIAQDGGGREETQNLDPTRLLGAYKEQVELAERERLEKEEADAKVKARDGRAASLVDKFFAMTGVERLPEEKRHYHQAFRAGYQGDVEINVEGVAALLKVLEPAHDQAA